MEHGFISKKPVQSIIEGYHGILSLQKDPEKTHASTLYLPFFIWLILSTQLTQGR